MLEGRLVRLRPRVTSDGANMRRWLNDQEIARLYGERYPRSLVAAERGIEGGRLHGYDWVRFAVETLAGEHIGGGNIFDVSAENRSAQIGVLIGERAYWSRGYGSDAVRLLMRFGFEEMNLHRMWLQVWSFNERAMRAYRKLGFTEEARLRRDLYSAGEYHEVVVMGVLEDEYRAMAEATA